MPPLPTPSSSSYVRDRREGATYVRVREPLPGPGQGEPDAVLLYAVLPCDPHRATAALAVLRQECPRARVHLVARDGAVRGDEATAEATLALASAPFRKEDRVVPLGGVRAYLDAHAGETVRVLAMTDLEPAFEGGGEPAPRVHLVTGMPSGSLPDTYYAHNCRLMLDVAAAEAIGAVRHERLVEVACGDERRQVWLTGGETRWLRFECGDPKAEVTVDGEPAKLDASKGELRDGRAAASLLAACADISPVCGVGALEGLPDVGVFAHAQRRQRVRWLVHGVQQAVMTSNVQYFTAVADRYLNRAYDELEQRARRLTQQYNVSLLQGRSAQVMAAIQFFTGGAADKRKAQGDGGAPAKKKLKPAPGAA